ncbi:MAG: radical SAM protein [Dictyoglomus sp. NZ13-RE01]|nr:MAG: radical SAM protein [Dictyoglomus sp. NZ13-RE01]
MDKFYYRLSYYKKGKLTYIGFLDLAKFIIRSLRRTGLPVAYSQGFNPQPLVSFSLPIPVGVESKREWIDIALTENVEEKLIIEKWNKELPDDLKFISCRFMKVPKTLDINFIKYELTFFHVDILGLKRDIENFEISDKFYILVRRGDKIKYLDMKGLVQKIELKDSDNIIEALVKVNNGNILRGEEILEIFTVKPIIKRHVRELITDEI